MALITMLREARRIGQDAREDGGNWYDASRLFPDAAKAAERVLKAVEENERIGLFGDYDCDGITSAAQIIRALRRRKTEPIVKLPHRVHDGYGIKSNHIEDFAQAGVTLLITVDTGISAHEAVDAAHAKGIDVIILDHHHVLTAPNAYAILHPALVDTFPHPHPSAAGVVCIFLHALEKATHWADREIDLALATIGTIADLVPLKGHNRSLVQDGLSAMRNLPMSPLRLLIDQLSAGKPLTSTDIAFRIAPRINAAGRMADPMLALRALLEGGALLNDLDTLNALRQDETQRALEKALTELTPGPDPSDPARADGTLPGFLSIASTSYPHGILGLLAGKLTEKFGRPSMAVHIAEDVCTASFRSPSSFNITEALQRNKEKLTSFGGHAQAAGATFKLDEYIALTEALEQDVAAHMKPDQLVPTLAVDAILQASAVTKDFHHQLSALEPYGMGNPEPLFLIEDVTLENMRRVGGEGRHLQATLGHCKVIGFNLGHLMEDVRTPVDIACRVGIDTWNGRETPQLFLQDLRLATKVTTNR